MIELLTEMFRLFSKVKDNQSALKTSYGVLEDIFIDLFSEKITPEKAAYMIMDWENKLRIQEAKELKILRGLLDRGKG
ncbi:MAG: hypothetical protein V3U84_02360 [Thiotrichaceae bacterium]